MHEVNYCLPNKLKINHHKMTVNDKLHLSVWASQNMYGESLMSHRCHQIRV